VRYGRIVMRSGCRGATLREIGGRTFDVRRRGRFFSGYGSGRRVRRFYQRSGVANGLFRGIGFQANPKSEENGEKRSGAGHR